MSIEITMPALSPTMESGTLAKWLVKAGDRVEAGDIIAEIETDKATMEVEAVDEGIVAHLLVAAGTEEVAVNRVIAVLAEEGEDANAVPAGVGQDADMSGGEADPGGPQGGSVAAPARTQPAVQEGDSGAAPAAAPGRPLAGSDAAGTRLKASPLARRIAAQAGIALPGLTGSGPHGRIIKKDVEAAIGRAKAAPVTPSDAGRGVGADGLILPQLLDDRIYDPESYTLEPLDGMRRTVARRLTESFMQVPHFPLNVDIALDRLLTARQGINDAAPDGVKISVNDLLIKASALALMAEPDCNASYTDRGIAYHKSAHVSVAVAVDGGLITPVIRDAQTKGLAALAAEMKDLAGRARARKLKPQEYTGGTFSISNLGMFGVKSFGSIINPPEGMILSVGAGEKRAVVDAAGQIVAATMMSVTLSCDHRVIGGAEGARWLAAFKRFVETPESMLL